MRKAILDKNGKVVDLVKLEEQRSQAYQDRVKHVQEYVAKKYGFDKGATK